MDFITTARSNRVRTPSSASAAEGVGEEVFVEVGDVIPDFLGGRIVVGCRAKAGNGNGGIEGKVVEIGRDECVLLTDDGERLPVKPGELIITKRPVGR